MPRPRRRLLQTDGLSCPCWWLATGGDAITTALWWWCVLWACGAGRAEPVPPAPRPASRYLTHSFALRQVLHDLLARLAESSEKRLLQKPGGLHLRATQVHERQGHSGRRPADATARSTRLRGGREERRRVHGTAPLWMEDHLCDMGVNNTSGLCLARPCSCKR